MVYKKKGLGSVIHDTTLISSILPWWAALFFGLFSFLLLYFIIPFLLNNFLQGSHLFPVIEIIYSKHIDKFQWAGIACGLIGLFFSARNYYIYSEAEYFERGIVSFLAKLFSRNID